MSGEKIKLSTKNKKQIQIIVLTSLVLLSIFISLFSFFNSNGKQAKANLITVNKTYFWGNLSYNNYADNIVISDTSTSPVIKEELSEIKKVVTGSDFSAFLTKDGKVFTKGSNIKGQLGNDSKQIQFSNDNLEAKDLVDIVDIYTKNQTTYAIDSTYRIHTWGDNECGKGLNGKETTFSEDETSVDNLNDIYKPYNTDKEATKVRSNFNAGYLLNTDGNILSWGCNIFGELGNGTRTDLTTPFVPGSTKTQLTPSAIPDFSGIQELSANGNFALALKSDNTLWSWGANEFGQLGLGDKTGVVISSSAADFYTGDITEAFVDKTRTSPTLVGGIPGVKKISTGSNFAVALTTDNRLFSWGNNENGRLGLNTASVYDEALEEQVSFEDKLSPTQLTNLNGLDPATITDIQSGDDFTMVLTSGGEVWSWGGNDSGQLGLGDNVDRLVPTKINSLSKVQSISVGGSNVFAIVQEEVEVTSSSSTGNTSSSTSNVSSDSSSNNSSSQDSSVTSSIDSSTSSSESVSSSVSSVDSSTSSSVSVSSSSSNPLSGRTFLLDVGSVKFSPAKEVASRFKDNDLRISVENNSDLVEGAVCVFKGTEYKTSANQNPVTITVGTSTYSSGKAETTLTKEQQNTPKWEFDIRCTNPSNVGENSNLSFGNNPSYFFKYGAIATVEIKGFVL